MGEHLFVWNVQLDLSATDKKGKKNAVKLTKTPH